MIKADTISEIRISLPWKWRPLKRHKLPGSEFFADGDEVLRSTRKLIPLETTTDEDSEYAVSCKIDAFPCGVPGCTQNFSSLLSYENHYNSLHRHTCCTCHRTFPSLFLLDIHLQEQHDSLFTVMATRQNMYQCLVEQCIERFASPTERRTHLIKVHKYPANFRFHRDSMSGAKKKHAAGQKANAMEVDHSNTNSSKTSNSEKAAASPMSHLDISHSPPSGSSSDKENIVSVETAGIVEEGQHDGGVMEVEAGVGRVKSGASPRIFVHKVPANFSFGHGVARGFQRPAGKKKKKNKGGHWHQKMDDSKETTTDIANVDMTDMADALKDV